jgi:hypothetical protein
MTLSRREASAATRQVSTRESCEEANRKAWGCSCCGDPLPPQGLCTDCALTRCDAEAGACGKPRPGEGQIL